MNGSPEQTGSLTVRVWFEPTGLRARITSSLDVASLEPQSLVVDSGAKIQATVADWILRFEMYQRPATPT